MDIILFTLIILLVTLNWVINRYALHNGADSDYLGISITFFTLLFGIISAIVTGKQVFISTPFIIGTIAGVTYSIGYCLIVFHCLRIGPSGPTVTVYNLGMLWPIIIGLIWFPKTGRPSYFVFAGIIITILALILISWGKTEEGSETAVTGKWLGWIFAGWLLSGMTKTCQLLASQSSPNNSYPYLIGAYVVSLIFLGVTMSIRHKSKSERKSNLPNKVELIAGAINGFSSTLTLTMQFILLNRVSAALVFPVMYAAPILLMLLIGHYAFKEKLNLIGKAACIIGVAGVILLNIQV